MKEIIALDHASVRFNMASEKVDNLKEYMVKLAKRQLRFKELMALSDLSLSVGAGEALGVVGRNGAGKSTLLKLIAGILSPTSGSCYVEGSVAPLIELGAGFDPNLTAGENIYLNGALLGHTRKEMRRAYDEIVDFAELSAFMEMPLKNYSTGMRARLGFSVATMVKPDILLVDETLSVGDAAFQKKCMARMESMLREGVTLLYVSHSTPEILRLCTRALWLDHGRMRMEGRAEAVAAAYMESLESEDLVPNQKAGGEEGSHEASHRRSTRL